MSICRVYKKKRAKYSTRKRWEHIFTYEKREGGWIRGVHPPRVGGGDLFTKRNSIPKFSVAVVISFNRINFKQLSVYIDSGNWKKRNWKLQHQIAGLKVGEKEMLTLLNNEFQTITWRQCLNYSRNPPPPFNQYKKIAFFFKRICNNKNERIDFKKFFLLPNSAI